MTILHKYGRINSTTCFKSYKIVDFDVTKRTKEKWCITAKGVNDNKAMVMHMDRCIYKTQYSV